MGREQRIAEKRAKEALAKQKQKQAQEAAPAPAREVETKSDATTSSVLGGDGAGKTILQVLLLYLAPIGLVILLGKLLFGL